MGVPDRAGQLNSDANDAVNDWNDLNACTKPIVQPMWSVLGLAKIAVNMTFTQAIYEVEIYSY